MGNALVTEQVVFTKNPGVSTGRYYKYDLLGDITLTFTATNTSPNAVLSGIFYN